MLKMGLSDWRSEIDQWDNNGILRGGQLVALSLHLSLGHWPSTIEWRKYKKKKQGETMRFLAKRNKSNLWGDLDSEIACYFSSIYFFYFSCWGMRGDSSESGGRKKN